ncbi:MAG: universal stress protein [Candidatus Korobacteraceae bacterium]
MTTAQITPAGVGIHNVLIATDFSHYSNVALNFGLELAHDYCATAYVVSVIPTDEILIAGPDAYVAAKDATRRDLLELKAELARTHSLVEGKDYHLYMLEGAVARAILDFANSRQIDLIVVATHGRSGLGKALMGSVAEKVFRQSPVPVLSIGPRVHRAGYKHAPQNILVPADFTLASERAVRYAGALARQHKATLTLLHVLSSGAVKGVSDRATLEQRTYSRLAELLGREAEGVRGSMRVEVGRIQTVILENADKLEADLLVMGVRPWNGILDHLMWPHAYEVVRESPCPVVTVRGTPANQ